MSFTIIFLQQEIYYDRISKYILYEDIIKFQKNELSLNKNLLSKTYQILNL